MNTGSEQVVRALDLCFRSDIQHLKQLGTVFVVSAPPRAIKKDIGGVVPLRWRQPASFNRPSDGDLTACWGDAEHGV